MTNTRLAEVPVLLKQKMASASFYNDAQLNNALTLWHDFIEEQDPASRKPEIYAAGVDYLIGLIDRVGAVTQSEVASRYGTSVSSVSSVYQLIAEVLDIDERDSVYSSSVASSNMSDLDRAREMLGWGDTIVEWTRATTRDLKRLPQRSEQWSVVRFDVDVHIADQGDMTLSLYLVHDDEAREVIGHAAFPMDMPHVAEVGDMIADTMLDPMRGEPRRPTAMRFDDEELMMDIHRALGSIKVQPERDPCEDLDYLRESAQEALGFASGDRSYLQLAGVTPELIAEFFEAAALFFERTPWQLFDPEDLFEVQIDFGGETETRIVGVMGHNREVFGATCFDSIEEYEAFAEVSASQMFAGGEPGEEFSLPTSMALSFDHPEDLGPNELAEVEAHDWRVADPDFIPILVKTSGDMMELPLTQRDYVIGTCIARGVASIARGVDADRTFPLDEELTDTSLVPNLPGAASVKTRLMVDYKRQKRAEARQNFDPMWNPTEAELHTMEGFEYIQELITQYAESDAYARFIKQGHERQFLVALLEDAAMRLGTTPPRLTEAHVRHLVLELLPAQADPAELHASDQIAELRAFWEFMHEAYGIERPEIRAFLNQEDLATKIAEASQEAMSSRSMFDLFSDALREAGASDLLEELEREQRAAQQSKKKSKGAKGKKKRKKARDARKKNRNKKK